MIVESDSSWNSVVISNVKIPKNRGDVWAVEQALCEELGAWNPILHHGVKNVQVMCRIEDVLNKDRRAVRISFDSEDEVEHVLRRGIYLYGEHCRVAPYQPQKRIKGGTIRCVRDMSEARDHTGRWCR
jgi:hypothetical protein